MIYYIILLFTRLIIVASSKARVRVGSSMGRGGKLPESGKGAGSAVKSFTIEEVKKHNKPNDAWIVVNGKVRVSRA